MRYQGHPWVVAERECSETVVKAGARVVMELGRRHGVSSGGAILFIFAQL